MRLLSAALIKCVTTVSILVHLPLLCAQVAHQEKTYTASRLPGKDNFASYSAVYTDKVTLRCPNEANLTQPSWGRIVHGRKLGIAQCYDNTFNCTIYGGVVNEDGIQLLSNDDSGLYFCRDARSYDEAYYLNLTVFSPPQILGNIAGCTSSHLCEQSHPSLNPNSDNQFTVTVEYFGDNVTTVDWQRDGEQIDCSRKQCTMMNMSNGLYHKSSLTVRVFHAGHDSEFTGNYTANISSHYGWNVSLTRIQASCSLNPPEDCTRNETRTARAGDTNVKISCDVQYGDVLPYIAMCYAPSGESLTELNVSENCLLCDLQQRNGYCNKSLGGRFSSRPKWKVKLNVSKVQTCIYNHRTELEIPSVSLEDNNGIVYCTWSRIPSQMHVYNQYQLEVERPLPTWIKLNWKYMAMGGTLFVSLILVIVLLLAFSVRSWKKARRAEVNRRRRLERKKPRQSNSPPLPPPRSVLAEQTGSDLSDSEVVFRPQRSSRSPNSSQPSSEIVLDAEVHDQSPLLTNCGQPPTSQYGAVSKCSHHQDNENFTDAPLICTTADEGDLDWRLPGANRAQKSNV